MFCILQRLFIRMLTTEKAHIVLIKLRANSKKLLIQKP